MPNAAETRFQLTPHTRAAIHRALKEPPYRWSGRRKGVKLEFSRSDQPTLEGSTVAWRARIGRIWHQGKAASVWDAIKEISTQL